LAAVVSLDVAVMRDDFSALDPFSPAGFLRSAGGPTPVPPPRAATVGAVPRRRRRFPWLPRLGAMPGRKAAVDCWPVQLSWPNNDV
jgi:hypothetical protein